MKKKSIDRIIKSIAVGAGSIVAFGVIFVGVNAMTLRMHETEQPVIPVGMSQPQQAVVSDEANPDMAKLLENAEIVYEQWDDPSSDAMPKEKAVEAAMHYLRDLYGEKVEGKKFAVHFFQGEGQGYTRNYWDVNVDSSYSVSVDARTGEFISVHAGIVPTLGEQKAMGQFDDKYYGKVSDSEYAELFAKEFPMKYFIPIDPLSIDDCILLTEEEHLAFQNQQTNLDPVFIERAKEAVRKIWSDSKTVDIESTQVSPLQFADDDVAVTDENGCSFFIDNHVIENGKKVYPYLHGSIGLVLTDETGRKAHVSFDYFTNDMDVIDTQFNDIVPGYFESLIGQAQG